MGEHDQDGEHGAPGGGEGRLVFRNYAKAHRHGHVVGQLPGGHAIPFGPYTLTQVGVFVTALVGLYLARGLWMHFGRVVDLLVLVGVPYALAVAERFVRPEGRSPLRSVAALAGYATFPRGGRLRGRPLPTRTHRLRLRPTGVFVRDLPDASARAVPAPSRTDRAGSARHRRTAGLAGRRRPRWVAGSVRRAPSLPGVPAESPVPAVSPEGGAVAASSRRSAGSGRRVPPAHPVPAAPGAPMAPAPEASIAPEESGVPAASAVPAGPAMRTRPASAARQPGPAGPVTLADLLAAATAPADRVPTNAGEGR